MIAEFIAKLIKGPATAAAEKDIIVPEHRALLHRYAYLLDKWTSLVNRINSLGGEAFLRQQTAQSRQLTKAEIMTLIRLCHPDKHGGDTSANEVTKKLLEMRDSAPSPKPPPPKPRNRKATA